MSKREVKYVTFHEAPFVPGLGDFGKTLPSQNKTLPGLKMFKVEDGIEVQVGSRYFFVAMANVKVAEFSPEQPAAAKATAEPKAAKTAA